jgi:hypothetical protein
LRQNACRNCRQRQDAGDNPCPWLKLLNMSDEIRAFIAENEARLKAKD